MNDAQGLLPGTLDLLILKAVSLGTLHGYGVLLRIQQISGGALQIQQGALYPALYRLERQGLIESEWGLSENNRRAKFYRLTAAGRARMEMKWQAGTVCPTPSPWRCGRPAGRSEHESTVAACQRAVAGVVAPGSARCGDAGGDALSRRDGGGAAHPRARPRSARCAPPGPRFVRRSREV